MVGEYITAAVLLVTAVVMFKVEAYVVAVALAICAGVLAYVAEDVAAAAADYERQRQAQRAADAKPRPVSRSDDGCVVYAFKPHDRWMYFTRCNGAQTTTTNVHKECSGSGKHHRCTDVITEVGAQ